MKRERFDATSLQTFLLGDSVMTKSILFATLICFASIVRASATCDALSVEQVNKALPDFAPWILTSGGPGSCTFSPNKNGFNEFSITQRVENSEAEASDSLHDNREAMVSQKAVVVRDEPSLGKGAFSYSESDKDLNFATFSASRKRMTVEASLTVRRPITSAQYEGAKQLEVIALSSADNESIVAAASHCPYFDAAVLQRLLPGAGLHQTVRGKTGCDAQADTWSISLSIEQDNDADRLAMLFQNGGLDSGCTSEPLPKLGPNATLNYNCEGPSKSATVRFLTGHKLFEYSLFSSESQSPTAAQRATLVELVEHAPTK
jgi:hypothetical protein